MTIRFWEEKINKIPDNICLELKNKANQTGFLYPFHDIFEKAVQCIQWYPIHNSGVLSKTRLAFKIHIIWFHDLVFFS